MNYEHLTLGVEDSMKRGQSCAVADSGARILAQFPGIWDGCPGFSRAQKVSPVTFFSGFRMVLPLRSVVGAGSLVPLEMSDRPNIGGRAKLDHHRARNLVHKKKFNHHALQLV